MAGNEIRGNKSNINRIIENLGQKLHKYRKFEIKYNMYSNI